jgi:hypothetical protein
MDGEIWIENRKEENFTDSTKPCRDMAKCFKNEQRISHTIGNKTRIGIYDSTKNGIIYDGKILSLNKFAESHYESERPDRTSNVNAWKECKCELNGTWISTYCLPG